MLTNLEVRLFITGRKGDLLSIDLLKSNFLTHRMMRLTDIKATKATNESWALTAQLNVGSLFGGQQVTVTAY